jgi:hypothetical protein
LNIEIKEVNSMATLFQDYLGHNLLEVVARSTVFEDYVLTKEEVQQVVNTHFEPFPFGYKTRKEILNLYEAWIFVHLFSSSDVGLSTFEALHEIISDGVTDKPQLEGHFRSEDTQVVISKTTYQPPLVSRVEAQAEFNQTFNLLKDTLSSDYIDRYVKVEQILMFYIYLMRRQFFHDCNKRTATLFVNLMFNYYDLDCFLWFPTLEELDTFLAKLKVCYENQEYNTDCEFVDYLKANWLVNLSM